MRRRDFITLLGGAVLESSRAALAQVTDRVRRIDVLMSFVETDPEGQARMKRAMTAESMAPAIP